MAFSGSLLSEDQLQCSICLDVFTDPVSTPCGHNFCMICLKEFWNSSSHSQCPVCKKAFLKRPELRVNTFISGLAALFKKQLLPKPKKVLCDSCTEGKLEALRSCLHCGVSLCNIHLNPHKTTAKLMRHKLVEPVENLEDYICQKHERPLELFCRECQLCVCQFCTEGDHRTHNTVSVEVESAKNKTGLLPMQSEVQEMIQDRLRKIREIKYSAALNEKITEKADVVEIVSALMRCSERSQAELLKEMEEKQKAAERQAEEFIKDLEQEITELKRRNTELEQLSHTEDHIYFLQIYPSLRIPPHTQDWFDFRINSHLSVVTQIRIKIQEMFSMEVGRIDAMKLKEFQLHAVDVTLDPETANPFLIVSDGGKQVACGNDRQNLPDKPERFDHCGCVLGKEGFSSGRFYYEVQVSGNTEWDLGVARASAKRKGEITACPENGYWCLSLKNETELSACDSPHVPLSLNQSPQKIGVFVDYNKGLVSFNDVEAKSHIYSFTSQNFMEKIYPVFSLCLNHD
ncbi:E3 ubiquitin-protein ligase TRIM39-like isoform X1, partial [Clarias magur]